MRVRRAAAVVVVAAGAMLPLVGVASAQDSDSLPAGLSSTPANDDDESGSTNDDESGSTNGDESGSTNDDESGSTNDDESGSTDDDDESNQVGTLPQGGVETGDGSTVG
jgi:hypothetical protein